MAQTELHRKDILSDSPLVRCRLDETPIKKQRMSFLRRETSRSNENNEENGSLIFK